MRRAVTSPFATPYQRAPVLALALVVLLALVLRASLLGVDVRFHPDEALFAAQARLISHEGDVLLRTTDLDKPPLTFYATALSFRLLGPSEFAARLPNVIASTLTVVVMIRLATALYRDQATALLVACLCALSPYLLAFAATTFTDVQATLWVTLATLLAVKGQWRSSGIAAALALSSKTTAALFLPLIVGLGLLNAYPVSAESHRPGLRRIAWHFGLSVGIGVGALILWDVARHPRSFFALGFAHNNPGRLIRSDELWPRLDRWFHWLGYVTGSPVLTGILLVCVLGWLAYRFRAHRTRQDAADWIITGFSIALLGWYWLVAFNTYDRYLYPLVPFLLLLFARVIVALGRIAPALAARPLILATAPAFLLVPAVIPVLDGRVPLGGDQGTHTGIEPLATFLNETLEGDIVYDHWLGWELAFYLGPRPRLLVRYSPHPEELAGDMTRCACTRFFVVPDEERAAHWRDLLARNGIHIASIYSDPAHGFTVYRLSAEPRE